MTTNTSPKAQLIDLSSKIHETIFAMEAAETDAERATAQAEYDRLTAERDAIRATLTPAVSKGRSKVSSAYGHGYSSGHGYSTYQNDRGHYSVQIWDED